jgi:proliferating cell nuclear antigen PCNA
VGDDKKIFDRFFEVPLMDLEMDLLEIPHIEHQAEFSISSVNFAGLINQMKQFGDTMQIECTEEKITLGSFSVDQGKMFAEISIDELQEFAIEEGEKIAISFSLKYLHDICLYHKISKHMDVKISSDFPMKIIYRLPDTDVDATMTFFLAPKIDHD